MRNKGDFLAGLLAGTVAGAVAALLLTPRKLVARPGNSLPIKQSDSGRGPRARFPTSETGSAGRGARTKKRTAATTSPTKPKPR